MKQCGRRFWGAAAIGVCALACASAARADVSLGGFTPFVGIGLTRQFATVDTSATFFIAEASPAWSGTPLGPSGTPYFDIALLDTGAATHILTQTAANNSHFGIHVAFANQPDGFGGTNHQQIFGATGPIDLLINDPLGVYAGGLAHSTYDGTTLSMNTAFLRGQKNIATLEAPAAWKLPNIIGLPMAAQHGLVIRNDQPQVFQFQNRTLRTPNVELIALGTGSQQGITRRTNLRLNPSASFITGPFYLQSTEIGPNLEFNFHENPQSPTVLDSGGLYVDVDMTNDGNSVQDKQILFDTGADLTVLSEVFAASLGLDVALQQPDFFLEVEGSAGVVGGVPGFYVDEIKIDAVGGAVVFHDVPVAVLDVPNPTEPANVVDAILGMHLFNDRNLVIDAVPIATGNGASPRLYISDPVTETHVWAAPTAIGTWSTAANWSAAGTPAALWIAQAQNTTLNDKTASVTANSQVFQLRVSATAAGRMIVDILGGTTLTTFGEARIEQGGVVVVEANGRLDSQVVNLYDGGTLAGEGTVFVGSGPIHGAVRNLSGRVAPGTLVDPVGQLSITGDYSNLGAGTLAIDLAGLTPITQYDRLAADRFAFLGGTLEVTLNGFTPSVGNTFTILTAGQGVTGEFQYYSLPPGFLWNVAYNANNVVLSVTGIGLAGDFNSDGIVDARDYVVWRNNGGTPQEYQTWRNNFGLSIGSGTAAGAQAVPEPAAATWLLAAAGGARFLTRRRATRLARSSASIRCATPWPW